jgi:hypothetical protein
MLPSAIFNRFDLSASNGQHCGEYRVIYHKNLLLMNADRCKGIAEALGFADVLSCK